MSSLIQLSKVRGISTWNSLRELSGSSLFQTCCIMAVIVLMANAIASGAVLEPSFNILLLLFILIPVVVVRPIVGLFLVVFASIAAPIQTLGSVGTLSRLSGLLLAAGFAVSVLIRRSTLRVRSATTFPFLVFLGWRLFEILRTRAPEAAVWIKSPGSLSEFVIRLAMFLALYVFIVSICRRIEDIHVVTAAIILAAIFSATYTLLVDFGVAPSLYDSGMFMARAGRISGLRGNSNENALLLNVGIGFLIPFILTRRFSGRMMSGYLPAFLGRRSLVWAAMAVLLVALILSGSRGGAVTLLALAMIVLFVYRLRAHRLIYVGVAVSLLILSTVPVSTLISDHLMRLPFLTDILYGESVIDVDTSAATRLERALHSIDIFEKSPLIGVGYGNYELEIVPYLGFGTTAHSLYAEILAEEGLVGFAIYLYFIVAIARTYWASQRTLGGKDLVWPRLLCQGFMFAFVAFSLDRVFATGEELNKLVFVFLGMADVFAEYARKEGLQ